jgi:hypothetical protein
MYSCHRKLDLSHLHLYDSQWNKSLCRFFDSMLKKDNSVLTNLRLNGCSVSTNELKAIFKHRPKLKELSIGNIPQAIFIGIIHNNIVDKISFFPEGNKVFLPTAMPLCVPPLADMWPDSLEALNISDSKITAEVLHYLVSYHS